MRKLLLIVFFSLFTAKTSAQDFETWRSGKFAVEARLLDGNPTHIRLQKRDGQVLTVPIERLSNHCFARLHRDSFVNRTIGYRISGEPDNGILRVYNYKLKSQILGPIVFSRDSRVLFFATSEKILAIDSETGHILHTEQLPKVVGGIKHLVVSRDGHFLAAAGKLVLAWQIQRNSRPMLVRVAASEIPQDFSVTGLAMSPDSEHIATASRDGEVRVIETATGSLTLESDKTLRSTSFLGFKDNKTLVLSDGNSKVTMDIESVASMETLSISNGRDPYFTESLTKWSVQRFSGYQVFGVEDSAIEIGDSSSFRGFKGSFITSDGKSLFALSPHRIAHWDVKRKRHVGNYNILMKTATTPDAMDRLTFSACERYIAGISSSMQRIYIYQPTKL